MVRVRSMQRLPGVRWPSSIPLGSGFLRHSPAKLLRPHEIETNTLAGDATRQLAKGVVREDPSEVDTPLNFVQRAALSAWLSSFKRKYEVVGRLYRAPEAETMAAAAEEAQAAGERMLRAAVAGDAETLRHELQAGTPIAFCDDSGWQALHYASNNGRVAATKLLLEAGASVDAVGSKGRTALHHAAEKDHVGVVEVLGTA